MQTINGYFLMYNDSMNDQTEQNKKQFSDNIKVIVNAIAGALANKTASAVQSNIGEKIQQKKKQVERRVVTSALLGLGALLTVYGGAQVLFAHLGYSIYANLGIGIVFLFIGLILHFISSNK